ncbi:MAG: hypothetical protein ACLQVI_14635 [Polyangiaceae bacterium]
MTPEEESKQAVASEFALLTANAELYAWEARLEDRGDYHVIYVRLAKPGGRTFVLRLECDDYPRRPPLAQFVSADSWTSDATKDTIDPPSFPRGDKLVQRPGKAYLVMCIRGHREFYENNWHQDPPWTQPPHPLDTAHSLVHHIRTAVHDLWE